MGAGSRDETVTLVLGEVVGAGARDGASDAGALRPEVLVESARRAHGGRLVVEGEVGGGFAIGFGSARDAVSFALDLQRAPDRPAGNGQRRATFRLGIHSGDVRVADDGRLTGEALIHGGVLRDLCHAGQVLLSGTTERLLVDGLPDGAAARLLGDVDLPGRPGPEPVHQLVAPHLRDRFPSIIELAAPSYVPDLPSSFIGRAPELDAVHELLETRRLVTLTGTGGAGKTRLALEVGRSDRRSGAAWWVDLAEVAVGDRVQRAVADAVGARIVAGTPTLDVLVQRLRRRPTLLILDNCEHLIDACASMVSALAVRCPELRVMATSREPLGMQGEHVYRVPPLGLDDAVQLFRDRRGAVDSGPPDGTDADSIEEICRRLDGLPLAIELAAARAPYLGVEGILEGLDDRFRLLVDGARQLPPRQRTLEATVRSSYSSLTPDEQRVLARLSVFAGTFGRDAALAVAALGGLSQARVDEALETLVRRSLVQPRGGVVSPRFRLLETVRVFARERLDELEDPTSVERAHLLWAVDLARRASMWPISDPGSWHARVADEVSNLRAAIDRAVETDQPAVVIDLVEPLFTFWAGHNMSAELHELLRQVTSSAGLEARDRSRGLEVGALLATLSGSWAAGYTLATEAVETARAAGDRELLVRAAATRAWSGFFSLHGSNDQIARDVDRAIRAISDTDDPRLVSHILCLVGYTEALWRDPEAGQRQMHRALDVAEAAGQVFQLIQGHGYLAFAQGLGGRLASARGHERAVSELGEPLQAHAGIAFAQSMLSYAEALHGNEGEARRLAREAADRARASGLPLQVLISGRARLVVEVRFGEASTALRLARDYLARARALLGGGVEEVNASVLVGIAALRAGETRTASEHFGAARAGSRDPTFPFGIAMAAIGLANLALREGDLDTAWGQAHEALEVAAEFSYLTIVLDALDVLGTLAVVSSSPELGARLLAAAEAERSRTGVARFLVAEPERRDALAQVGSSLSVEREAQLRAEGTALDLDAAVAYARRGRGSRGRPATGWQSLTEAELRVVELVVRGLRNVDVAEQLFISLNTVKTHLRHIYAKLGLSRRAELVSEATRRGL